jgi:chitinase
VAITEGSAGTTEAVFVVSLSGASDAPVTVQYSTLDNTAIAGSDYVAAAGSLTFAPGETNKSIAVAVLGDQEVEANETFAMGLQAAAGAVIADPLGVGTIVNDDVPSLPALRVSDVSKSEGRSGTTAFSFVVTLSAPSTVPVTVHYATANGTATVGGGDYTAKCGTLTFQPGQTSKTITVSVKGDRTKEVDETFFVNLSGATNAQIADGQGQGTILNDDGVSTGGKKNGSRSRF